MTNREKLNAMINKDLSEILRISCKTCPASEYCDSMPEEMPCDEVIESWLNEEEENEHMD